MTVYLMLYLCTSAECRASVAPTLEHLRAEGVKHAVAHCEADE